MTETHTNSGDTSTPSQNPDDIHEARQAAQRLLGDGTQQAPLTEAELSARVKSLDDTVSAFQELEQFHFDPAHEATREAHKKQVDLVFEHNAKEEELRALATTDTLTGLFNRRGFLDQYDRVTSRLRRNNSTGSLLVVDLDYFKEVNDSQGHDAGDETLRKVARRIEGAIRTEDIAARMGGDEFTILLADDTLEQGQKVGERLLEACKEEGISCSIGVSTLNPNADRDLQLKEADTAMYEAKHNGRGQVSVLGLESN